jgi:REP element-mobilizing transposase RayT
VARPLRIVFAGASYHLITRGNARQSIYADDLDRECHLQLLARTVDRYGWRCHAYCLLGNHYHLVVETPRPNLPVAMRQLNGLYARHFNDRYDRCGHVFQSRYRSILIENDEHLLNVCRYVVLNPVRAGISVSPADYRWSSYRATAGLANPPDFLTVARVLGHFDGRRVVAQARWRAYVEEGSPKRFASTVNASAAGASSRTPSATSHRCPRSHASRSSHSAGSSARSSSARPYRLRLPIGGMATRSGRSETTSTAITPPSAGNSSGKNRCCNARPDPQRQPRAPGRKRKSRWSVRAGMPR